jgi:hypothetical protein
MILRLTVIENHLLVNELQLDNQLNQCIQTDRRADFALMLSMLTDDVRDAAEFQLPHLNEQSPKALSDNLRKHFSLPETQALAINKLSDIGHYSQAEIANDNRMLDIQLLDALKPLPLAFRDDKKHINTDIMGNTSVHCQQRVTQVKIGGEVQENKRLNFNAKDWLKTVQQSILLDNVRVC